MKTRISPISTGCASILVVCTLLTAHAQVPAGAKAASPPAVAPVPTGPANVENYVIGPGDTLQIFVWRNPELSGTVPVRPDGKISTPLVEDMVATGKSPSALARDIEKVLSEFVRSPQVNVIVSNAMSAFSQVKVVGQVKNPQAVAYRNGLKVLDVVLATGGITDFAAGNRARIVRQVDGKSVEIRVKLDDLLNRGDLRQNYELRPGDVFIVPQTRF
jgi:polysaccharide export outer membrane protein